MVEQIKVRPVTEHEIRKHLDVLWFVSATSLEDSMRYWPPRMSDEPEIITYDEHAEG